MAHDLARLAGEHEGEEQREQVYAAVDAARERERVENRECRRDGRDDDELRLPVEVDDVQEKNQEGGQLACELCFGQERFSLADGVVDLARVVHLDVVPCVDFGQVVLRECKQGAACLEVGVRLRGVDVHDAD